MAYKPSRKFTAAVGTILISFFVGLVTKPYWDTAKEAYFEAVFDRCAHANDLSNANWSASNGPKFWFDAQAREFVPVDSAGLATVACTKRWAAFAISDAVEPASDGAPSTAALRVIVSGQTISPPQHIVRIEAFSANE
ncbi:hypothetical protein [Novosphingobium mangrovi (ex Huang et al. 2023)]|uniref:Uncharacterized protein n=1 Tax=Novosphingobium mangrovi (ex Huang et al. 2023) TaxID=2976432 RepID=A0ABT2I399_9SPHN|nr:hypothetical protein [Novosphingobium mangrovi (ex Huang et al. 2023)]MCT2399276.1 hypothetical protein [Novosphingobium mangrovi (ex Huang et al. 2023)]